MSEEVKEFVTTKGQPVAPKEEKKPIKKPIKIVQKDPDSDYDEDEIPTAAAIKRSAYDAERKRDLKMVKGMFKFYEVPQGSLKFFFKKYKEEPLAWYTMKDGETYEVPLMVAKHLNNTGWYPVHAYLQNEDGTRSVKVGKKVRRYGFHSLEFSEYDIATESSIITVERNIIR